MNERARECLVPNPKLKLRDQFHEVARYKHLSLRTEQTYWEWSRRYLVFHKEREGAWKHPADMSQQQVREFLGHLAVARNVAVSTQNQALNALVFLYREVLHRPFGELGEFERPQRRERLPVVLTRAEVDRVIAG